MVAFTAENFIFFFDNWLRPNWQHKCPALLELHKQLKLIEITSGSERTTLFAKLLNRQRDIFFDCMTATGIAEYKGRWKANKELLLNKLGHPDIEDYLVDLIFEFLPARQLGGMVSAPENWKKLKTHLESPSLKRIFKGKGRVMDTHYWKEKDRNKNIEYLNEEERKEKEIFVRAGTTALRVGARLVDRLGNLFDTKSMETAEKGAGWGAFVISAEQNRLYVNSHIRLKFHHSSFLSGARVHSAGEISVDSGKITHISPKSGHYKPDMEMLYYFLYWLIYRGYNLRDILVQPDIMENEWYDAFEIFSLLKSMSSQQRAAL